MNLTRPHVLLFSPDLEGHREVYCRVVARLLRELSCDVSVAGRLDPRRPLRETYPQLYETTRESGVTVYDVGADPAEGPRIDLDRLGARAGLIGADVVILMEADACLQVPAQRAVSLRGKGGRGGDRDRPRLVGVFVRSTNYLYEPSRGGTLRTARELSRCLARGSVDREVFHRLMVPSGRALDGALCLDERFVALRNGRHHWLPDIFAGPDLEPGAEDEHDTWRRRLDDMLAARPERPVVVYTGWADPRRGYPDLLRLAVEVGGVFLHCGDSLPADDPEAGETAVLRRRLADAGCLMETGSYYRSAATAAEFLRRAPCVVLPYRRHLGSSGAMLQALAAGRPVVVPEEGLMAWRVRCHGLGVTYPPGDVATMRRCYQRLAADGCGPYREAIAAYMSAYSDRQRSAALRAAVLGRGPGAALPGRRAAKGETC